MSNRDREHQVDSVSLAPGQYSSPYNALIRRKYMELAPDQSELYQEAFRAAEIDPDATVVDVGGGDGRDGLELAMNGHRGRIIVVEVPYPTSDGESFEDRFLPVRIEMEERGIDNIEFRPGYAEDIPVEDGEAGAIIYGSVLQHPKDSDYVMRVETRRALDHSGKVIIIHNTPRNKPVHHRYINRMGVALGSKKTPPPISSRFSIERAAREARLHYKVVSNYTVESALPITASTAPVLMASLDTYRELYWPPVSETEWLRTRREVVDNPLAERLSEEPEIYDLASRRVLILEKSLTPLQIARRLGFDALSRSGFARQKP